MLKTMYRWGVRVSVFVWLCLLLLVGARFTDQNPQILQVELFQWVLPELSAGVLLCAALSLGIGIGICAFLPTWVISRARLARLKAKLGKVEKKLVSLQSSTVSDPNITI